MSKTYIPGSTKTDSLLSRVTTYEVFHLGLRGMAAGVFCEICTHPLKVGDKIDWDHHLAETFDGKTDYRNVRPVHHECHKQKRRVKRSKATNQGKDNHEAKRANRIASGGKKVKHPMGKSRGFDTTLTRRMSGKVERRTP